MLVNMIGIEQEDEVVDLSTRRPPVNNDPKKRVTMTMLLQAYLTFYESAGSITNPVTQASTFRIDRPDVATSTAEAKQDAA